MINRIFDSALTVLIVVIMAGIYSVGIALLTGWLLSLCWNATLPELFKVVPQIDWWMGTKLMFLCSFLFKSSTSSN